MRGRRECKRGLTNGSLARFGAAGAVCLPPCLPSLHRRPVRRGRLTIWWQAEWRGPASDSVCSLTASPLSLPAAQPSEEALSAEQQGRAIDGCVAQLAARFDRRLGGFGGAPKFPRPAEINALLAQHARLAAAGDAEGAGARQLRRKEVQARTRSPCWWLWGLVSGPVPWHVQLQPATCTGLSAPATCACACARLPALAARVLHMATFSLKRMAAGGMYDHVGGGFHRYSVDEHWHVRGVSCGVAEPCALPRALCMLWQVPAQALPASRQGVRPAHTRIVACHARLPRGALLCCAAFASLMSQEVPRTATHNCSLSCLSPHAHPYTPSTSPPHLHGRSRTLRKW